MFSASWEGFSIAIYAHTTLAVYLFNVPVLINMRIMRAYMKLFYLAVEQKISLIR